MKKSILKNSVLVVMLFLMPSCNNEDAPTVKNTDNTRKEITLSRAEQELSAHCTDFAFRLLQEMNKEKMEQEPLVLSPLSASLALSMVANGAIGNAQQEIVNILGFNSYNIEEVNAYNQKLIKGLTNLDNTTTFCSANSFWMDDAFHALDSYKNTLNKWYEADLFTADFASPATIDQMNQWCSDKTNGLIPQFIGDLHPLYKLVLLNALYFKGVWKEPFEESATQTGNFTSSENEIQQVYFMKQSTYYKYAVQENATIVELPYGNEAFSMIVILPDEGIDMSEYIKTLNTDKWASIQANMHFEPLSLSLPKFKIEIKDDLTGVLQRMGITNAFNANSNFSNISKEKVYISKIEQANYFNIDEEGTDAAAVTGTGFVSSPGEPIEVKELQINRPFLFILKEKSTNTILFMGRMNAIK